MRPSLDHSPSGSLERRGIAPPSGDPCSEVDLTLEIINRLDRIERIVAGIGDILATLGRSSRAAAANRAEPEPAPEPPDPNSEARLGQSTYIPTSRLADLTGLVPETLRRSFTDRARNFSTRSLSVQVHKLARMIGHPELVHRCVHDHIDRLVIRVDFLRAIAAIAARERWSNMSPNRRAIAVDKSVAELRKWADARES